MTATYRPRRALTPADPAKHRVDGVVGALNQEWETLRHHLSGNTALCSWSTREPALRGFTELADIEIETRRRTSQSCDPILLALLRCAQIRQVHTTSTSEGADWHELATRTVVQLMLPKAVRIAHSQMGRIADREDRFTTVIDCLFEVVRTYPIDRRRNRVAANIALDTLNLTQRVTRIHSQASVSTIPLADLPIEVAADSQTDTTAATTLSQALQLRVIDPDDDLVAETVLAPDHPESAREEMVYLLVWAVEHHVLRGDEAALLARTYRHEAPADTVLAAECGCKPNTLRQRRRRAIARLELAAPQFLHEAA